MSPDTDFFDTAFRTVRTWLTDTAGLGGAERQLAAGLRARLKVALVLVRRLVFLLAMGAGLPDVPVPDSDPIERKSGRAHNVAPEPGPVRVGLTPVSAGFGPPPLPSLAEARPAAEMSDRIDRLMARLVVLYRIALDPSTRVARMAEALARQRAAGANAPVCPPMPRTHRLDPAMGLLAGAVQANFARAAAAWYETG